MSATLRLTLDRDTDGTGALNADVRAGAFAGFGQAWFNVESIADFGRALDAYPIAADKPPTIQGGYWQKDGSGIKQEHLFISVIPVGKRGVLAVEVHLATPDQSSTSKQRVELILLTNYGGLQKFAKEVQRLAAGAVSEAVLDADVAK